MDLSACSNSRVAAHRRRCLTQADSGMPARSAAIWKAAFSEGCKRSCINSVFIPLL